MHDIIQDLCTTLRDYESALRNLHAAGGAHLAGEVARMTRNVEICERWLQVAGGQNALARLRATGQHARPAWPTPRA